MSDRPWALFSFAKPLLSQARGDDDVQAPHAQTKRILSKVMMTGSHVMSQNLSRMTITARGVRCRRPRLAHPACATYGEMSE